MIHGISHFISLTLLLFVPVFAWTEPDRIRSLPVQTLDGEERLIENFGERKGTVLVTLSARCPLTEKHIEHLESLHEKYRFERILMVGIAPNREESGEELRKYLQSHGVRFPVYRDPTGATVRNLGATVTPEAFLVDEEGAVLYRGSVGNGDQGPLADAIESLHRGTVVEPISSEPIGTPIGETGQPRLIEDPYGTMFFSAETVFEKAGDAVSHHCSTLTEAPNGDLLCLWYGGSYESADDQSLFLARRKAGERVWSEPEVLIRNSINPPGNAVIFAAGDGKVWIVWGRMEGSRPVRRGSGWTECRLLYRTSEDNGWTWSEDRLFPIGERRALPRNIPITLADGQLLLPLTGLGSNSVYGAMAAITSDHGETWQVSESIEDYSQPTFAQISDGTVRAYLRSEPKIGMSQSQDGGLIWSPPVQTDLNCPGAGIAMTRLENGHLLMVFNDSPTDRTPLSIARSVDEGGTWEAPLDLESNPGEYSYPCILESRDGRIHITYTFRRYTIMHVEMNENWLVRMDRPN